MSGILGLGISPVGAAMAAAVWAVFAALWFGSGRRPRTRRRLFAAAWWGLAAAESVHIIILLANHIPYPAYLDLIEGTVLRHVQRLAAGQAVYAPPAPGFVALAYNPGYYVLGAPLTALFGSTVTTLRLLSALAFAGSAALVAATVRRVSGRPWVAAAAVALFLAGYQALGGALDNARPDAVFLFLALAGAACADRGRSRAAAFAAVLFWSAAFWCSQLGAIMAAGGFLFLWKRDGGRRALAPLLVMLAFTVLPYGALGRRLFGPQFHDFTLGVPGSWTRLDPAAPLQAAVYFVRFWPAPALAAAIALRERTSRSVWTALLPFAWATAVLGALHPGSSENVFIVGAVWTLLVGAAQMGRAFGFGRTARGWETAAALGLVISLTCVLDDPRGAYMPRSAARATADFAALVERSGAYAPQFGAVPGLRAQPVEAHWAALDDLMRAGGAEDVRRLLAARPLETIVTHWPMEGDPLLGGLAPDYRRADEFGERFAGMRTLGRGTGAHYPRFLYRRR